MVISNLSSTFQAAVTANQSLLYTFRYTLSAGIDQVVIGSIHIVDTSDVLDVVGDKWMYSSSFSHLTSTL